MRSDLLETRNAEDRGRVVAQPSRDDNMRKRRDKACQSRGLKRRSLFLTSSRAETSTENLHRDWYGKLGALQVRYRSHGSNSRLVCRSDVLVSVNSNRIRIVVSVPRRPHPEKLRCRRRERCNPSRK